MLNLPDEVIFFGRRNIAFYYTFRTIKKSATPFTHLAVLNSYTLFTDIRQWMVRNLKNCRSLFKTYQLIFSHLANCYYHVLIMWYVEIR